MVKEHPHRRSKEFKKYTSQSMGRFVALGPRRFAKNLARIMQVEGYWAGPFDGLSYRPRKWPKNTEGGEILTNPQLSTYGKIRLRHVDPMVLAMQAENADGNESHSPGGS